MVAPLPSPEQKQRNNRLLKIIALLLLFAALLFAVLSGTDFLEFEDGRPVLAPGRLGKLLRELDELENAEQYVLLASRDGNYPCFNCGEKTTIFLRKGEVWKYGVTRKGERERYGEWHLEQGLYYFIQYQGPLQECLRQEKIKIYHYATLPENLRREIPLIRPPGNKRDD
ncbi:MAG: hypothetical protein H6564_01525 [Lewinellaceae bacterium]|nr:hypothetical protein [Lewinellaceae bacterium]